MPRTDHDSWDLATSVGATATMVAAARAAASRSDQAVIDDPFAEPLVRAVGIDFCTRLATGELDPATLQGPDGNTLAGMRRFPDAMAARTRFFDEFFADAAAAGVRQAVILAAGLDARSYRLRWPQDMVVYEIDQPQVIEFKSRTLTELGAAPTAELKSVAIDLREDWAAALGDAGFDAAAPTAWIAEGLLGYLPSDAQDRLLDQVSVLSAPGSRFALESVPALQNQDKEEARAKMEDALHAARREGFDLDFTELVYFGDRADAADYLADRGWTTGSASANDLLDRLGLQLMDGDEQFADIVYVTATR